MRVVFLSDKHCGNKVGLTPTKYQRDDIFKPLQEPFWNWYVKCATEIRQEKKVDLVISNGDAIDGNGPKNGGVELITTNRLEQTQMAEECIDQFNPSRVQIIAGTPAHTGTAEDFEAELARRYSSELKLDLLCDIEGVVFQIRHHTNSSSVPYSRGSATQKELVWQLLESVIDAKERVDVVMRSHVHYFSYAETALGIAMTTPCLQLNSDYGKRRCQGITDIGFLVFDIENGQFNIERFFYPRSNYRNPIVKF